MRTRVVFPGSPRPRPLRPALAHGRSELTNNQLIGLGSALSVLTFLIVMAVSFLYIRFVGGNIRALAADE